MPFFNAPVQYEAGVGLTARGVPVSGASGATNFGALTDAGTIDLTQANSVTAAKIALLAPKADAALTGTPTAPTATLGTNTTQIANMAAVRAEIAALIASSPSALDTLQELANALGNDANFAATITALLGAKATTVDLNAGLLTKADLTAMTAALLLKADLAAMTAALLLKMDDLGAVALGSTPVTLTAAANGGRRNDWTGSVDAALPISTAGAVSGQIIEIAHAGAGGTLTLGASAATGYKHSLIPGEVGQVSFVGGSWVSSIPAPGGAGATPMTVTGTRTVGSTLTANVSAGWLGTYQWTRDGANISGATSSTYLQVTADLGHEVECVLTITGFTSTGGANTAGAVPGTVTGFAFGTATTTALPYSFTAPSSGGTPTDYVIEYRTPAGSGAWTTFADGVGTGTSGTITGLTAGTSYEGRATATNGSGTGTPSASDTKSTSSSAVGYFDDGTSDKFGGGFPNNVNPASDGGTWTIEGGGSASCGPGPSAGLRGSLNDASSPNVRYVRNHGTATQHLAISLRWARQNLDYIVLRQNGAGGTTRIEITRQNTYSNWQIFDNVAGTRTLLATLATDAWGGGMTPFSFHAVGTTVTVKDGGGTTIGTATTTITTGNWSGVYLDGADDYANSIAAT